MTGSTPPAEPRQPAGSRAVVELRPVDDAALQRLAALAVGDADPADVMPPGWTPGDISAFFDFYVGFRADSFEIVHHGDTVGFTRLTPEGETGLWVARSARGRGIGVAAVREVVDQAVLRRIPVVTARTTTANTAALSVLRRAGAALEVDGERVTARLGVPLEPPTDLADPVDLLVRYLDFYRATVLRKLDGLTDEQLRTSRVPSGWSPLGLVKHLAYVELRWLRWGFDGEEIARPYGDPDVEHAEFVVDGETADQVRTFYLEQCARSREIVAAARLDDRMARWRVETLPTPTLAWILFHLLQEYARHVGHLDVVRELTDGVTGQ
ncbi:GNAT family N-acetyltransferase [Saccharothrix variisporea]|uniref:Acetyltransferase (GNAT) family protein n=1 Tax=Saccharothrix variisporea TaxID=543527 RepID=A0A495X1S3_9PSEU|nr:GNAT family N-acetyltransferase [Saccharothrix variisporea]RKT67446.1 acetyltransferase (GNAT) family protein [Saccharothrix variisporea]